MKTLSSIKQPIWASWLLVCLSALISPVCGAAFLMFALALEVMRYVWRPFWADVQRTYWYERILGR